MTKKKNREADAALSELVNHLRTLRDAGEGEEDTPMMDEVHVSMGLRIRAVRKQREFNEMTVKVINEHLSAIYGPGHDIEACIDFLTTERGKKALKFLAAIAADIPPNTPL